MSNIVRVFEGNSATIEVACYNPDSTDAVLAGYTATLTVKTNKDDISSLFVIIGTVSGNDITFTVTASQNNRQHGVYYYEVVVTNGTTTITVVQDRYVIKESLVYTT